MSWDINELRDNIKSLYGKDQLGLISPCLSSIFYREEYARYHFREFESLLKEFLADKFDDRRMFDLMLGSDKEERSDFQVCLIRAEANVVACLQSMHAITDTLSHVIYYALNMNNIPDLQIKPRDVYITKVIKKLNINEKSKSGYASLCKHINDFIEHDDHKYLSDLVNYSKHRSIVKPSFTVKVNRTNDEDKPHGLEFPYFEYETKLHQKRWVDDYLKNEYARQNLLVIKIGNELNQIVRTEKQRKN